MSISRCKFCGSVVNTGHASCKECTQYCMTKCKIASNTTTSWHKEPCTKCAHNPYIKMFSLGALIPEERK